MRINKHINDIVEKVNKDYVLSIEEYNDHISCICRNHIIRIYQDKIYIIYAYENVETEIVKPSDIEYVNIVLQENNGVAM